MVITKHDNNINFKISGKPVVKEETKTEFIKVQQTPREIEVRSISLTGPTKSGR